MLDRIRRARRPIGVALVAYGIIGILAGVMVAASALAVADRGDATATRIATTRDALVSALRSASSAVDGVSLATARTTEGLTGAAALTGQVAKLSGDLAGATGSLADALETEMLGLRPFAGLAGPFRGISEQATRVGDSLGTVSTALAALGALAPPMAAELGDLSDQLAALATQAGELLVDEALASGVRGLALSLGLLLAWILAQAIVAVLVGVALCLERGAQASDPPGGPPA